MLFIESNRERLSAVALDGEESADALKTAASMGIVGGGIYDPMERTPQSPSWGRGKRAASDAVIEQLVPELCPQIRNSQAP